MLIVGRDCPEDRVHSSDNDNLLKNGGRGTRTDSTQDTFVVRYDARTKSPRSAIANNLLGSA